jgi:hypothetical protein
MTQNLLTLKRCPKIPIAIDQRISETSFHSLAESKESVSDPELLPKAKWDWEADMSKSPPQQLVVGSWETGCDWDQTSPSTPHDKPTMNHVSMSLNAEICCLVVKSCLYIYRLDVNRERCTLTGKTVLHEPVTVIKCASIFKTGGDDYCAILGTSC